MHGLVRPRPALLCELWQGSKQRESGSHVPNTTRYREGTLFPHHWILRRHQPRVLTAWLQAADLTVNEITDRERAAR
jgi:hypothetical protein